MGLARGMGTEMETGMGLAMARGKGMGMGKLQAGEEVGTHHNRLHTHTWQHG